MVVACMAVVSSSVLAISASLSLLPVLWQLTHDLATKEDPIEISHREIEAIGDHPSNVRSFVLRCFDLG
jgi:hypothetical protein